MSESNGNGQLISEQNHKVVDQLTEDQAQRKRIRALMEAAALDFGGLLGSGFDPYDMYQDVSGFNAFPYIPPPWYRQSQKRGELLPVYLDENQLRFIRDRSRKLWQENCFVRCAIANLQNYTVGEDGLIIRAVSADKNRPAPEQLLQRVQKVVDLWSEVNERPEFEADIVERLVVDGDKALRHFFQPKGIVLLRDVESEHIKPPPGGNYPPHTSFGVQTDPDDIHSVEGYWVVENPIVNPLPSFVPADEICYFKWNTPRSTKRGLPLFYETEVMLRDAVDLLRGCVVTANIRARYAVVRKFASPVIKEAVSKFLDEVNTSTANITDPSTGLQLNVERKPFGSVVNVGANTELDFPQANLESNQFYEALQMVLRAIAARICFPEFMLTADASNANYASTLVAEAPSTKMFATFQKRIKRKVAENRMQSNRSLAWTQVVYAVEVGILPPETLQLVKLQAEGATLIVRDQAGEAQTNGIYVQMGVKSKKTVSMEQGLDYEQEQANILEESQQALEQQARMAMAQQAGYVNPQANGQANGQQPQGGERKPGAPGSGPAGQGQQPQQGGYSRAELMHGQPVQEGVIPKKGGPASHREADEMLDELGDFYDRQGGADKGLEEAEEEIRKTTPSKAEVRISPYAQSGVEAHLNNLFPHLNRAQALRAVAHITGAPDDARVRLSDHGDKLHWEVEHDDLIDTNFGDMYIDPDTGKKHIYLDYYFPNRNGIAREIGKDTGSGIGTHMMNKMATAATQHGFDQIDLMAFGAHPNLFPMWSHGTGSRAWPAMGFDAPIKEIGRNTHGNYEARQVANQLHDDIRTNFPHAKTLQDVLATPEGREFWKNNYFNIDHAHFDLTPGSKSHQILAARAADPKHFDKMEAMDRAFPESGFGEDISGKPAENDLPSYDQSEKDKTDYDKEEEPQEPKAELPAGWQKYPGGHLGNPSTNFSIQNRTSTGRPHRLYHYNFTDTDTGPGAHGEIGKLVKSHPSIPHLMKVADKMAAAHTPEKAAKIANYGWGPNTTVVKPPQQEGNAYYGTLFESFHSHLRNLVNQARQGGFTYNLLSDEQPHHGYAVSPYPNRSQGFDRDKFGWRDLVHCAKANKDVLKKAPHHFGAWYHEPSGKIILDVSKIYGDPKQAEQEALYHDQQDYFDLAGGKSITVNPHATSGGILNDNPTETVPTTSSRRPKAGTSDRPLQRVEGQATDGTGIGRLKARVGRVAEGTGDKGVKDQIPGGKADNLPDSDFDPDAIKAGIKVEMEHTDDPDLAREIAKDHLSERPDYYKKLAKMEKSKVEENVEMELEEDKEPPHESHVKLAPIYDDDGGRQYPNPVHLQTNPSHEQLTKFLGASDGGKGIMTKEGNFHVWGFHPKGWTPDHEDVAHALGLKFGDWAAMTIRPHEDGLRAMARVSDYADRGNHRTIAHHLDKLPFLVRNDLGNEFVMEGREDEIDPRMEKEYLVESDDEGDDEPPPPRAVAKGKFMNAKRVEPRVIMAKSGEEAPKHILPNMVSPGARKVLVSTNPKSDILAMGVHGPDHPKTPNQPFTIYSDAFKKQYPRPSAHHDEAIALNMEPAHREEAKIMLSNGQEAPPHIKASMVTAGTKNFRVALNPESEVWITPGVNRNTMAGKTKGVNSPAYQKRSTDARQARVLKMMDEHDQIQQQIQADRKVPHKRDLAEIAWLLDKHGIRIGGDDTTRENQLRQQVDFDSELTPDMIAQGKSKKYKRGEKKGQKIPGKIGIIVDDDPAKPVIGQKRQNMMKLYGRGIPRDKVVAAIDDRVKPGFTDYREEGTAERLERFKKEGQPLGTVGDWLKAQGATTLQGKHVVMDDNGMLHLQFVGKKGVWHDHLVSDKDLSTILLQRAKKAGPEGRLYDVPYAKALEYTKGLGSGGYTPHDFRRKRATLIAQRIIGKHWPKEGFKSDAEFDDALNKVAKVVAAKLGNHPDEAKETYIMPKVYEKYKPKGNVQEAKGLGLAKSGSMIGSHDPKSTPDSQVPFAQALSTPPPNKFGKGVAAPETKNRWTPDYTDAPSPSQQHMVNDVPIPGEQPASKHPPLPEILKGTPNETPKKEMLQTPVDSTKHLKTKRNHVSIAYKIKFGNGEEGIFKPAAGEMDDVREGIAPGHGYKREAAVSSIADALDMHDLVPPTVEYNHPTLGMGSVQKWVPGTDDAVDVHGDEKYDGPRDHARAAALDYLVGNTDRHLGNWLLGPPDEETGDRKIWLIDHGYSLSNEPKEYTNDALVKKAAEHNLQIPDEVKNWDWDKLEEILDHHKIAPRAKELMRQRFEHLQDYAGERFGHLHDPKSFTAGRRKSTGLPVTQEPDSWFD